MKLENINKPFPRTQAEWDLAIQEAPGEDFKVSEPEIAGFQEKAAVVKVGGFEAVRHELGKIRHRGQRGPQKTPTKERITIRLSPEVVAQFRASGAGWQTRMDQALKEWLQSHSLQS